MKNDEEIVLILKQFVSEAEHQKFRFHEVNPNKYGISYIIDNVLKWAENEVENKIELIHVLRLLETMYKGWLIKNKYPCLECTEKLSYYEYLKANHDELLKLEKPWIRWRMNEYDYDAMEKYENEYNKFISEWEKHNDILCKECKDNLIPVDELEYACQIIQFTIATLDNDNTIDDQTKTLSEIVKNIKPKKVGKPSNKDIRKRDSNIRNETLASECERQISENLKMKVNDIKIRILKKSKPGEVDEFYSYERLLQIYKIARDGKTLKAYQTEVKQKLKDNQ